MKKTLEQEIRKAREFTNNEPLFTETELNDMLRFSSSQSTETGTTLFWRFVMIMNMVLSGLTLATLIPLEYSENPKRALRHPKESNTEIHATDSILKNSEKGSPLLLPEKLQINPPYSPEKKEMDELGVELQNGSTAFVVNVLVQKGHKSVLLDLLKKSQGTSSTVTLNAEKLMPILYNYGYDTTENVITVGVKIRAYEYNVKAEILSYDETKKNEKEKLPKPLMVSHDVRYDGKDRTSIFLFNTLDEKTNEGIKKSLKGIFEGKSTSAENEIIHSLVPVSFPVKGTETTLILWFYPTEGLNKVIPEDEVENAKEEKIVEYNKRTENEPVQQENNGGNSTLTINYISPNPAQYKADLSIDAVQFSEIKIGVYSLEGRLVMELPSMSVEKGNTVIPMEFQLPNGVYHVVVINSFGVQTATRLIVNK